ncbi:RecX family transcriptional regulator [Sneathiella sp. CAU 1612]|uniref:RecX family transcriptional regulator n=1 Tax=Sneathiella sedimenti TaxID=2816034 RepID=A0ABS3F9E9_9PROT|nr:RecX family transcriptional regulator [Sneathiella sedimenti]MBO0334952.1 RecX family transcriptional regulator [Sneathiella sedimenti]
MTDEKEPKAKRPRKPVEPTPKWLRDQALRYLNRFPATSRKMAQHLFNKAAPQREHFDLPEEKLKEDIAKVVEDMIKAGFINDSEFAASKVRIMARQGRSVAQIGLKLQEMEFSDNDQSDALDALGDDRQALDRRAAARFVKRRRFGPYKPEETRAERRNKELASLARQGFSFDVATLVIDAESVDVIETIIYGEE